MKGFVSLLVILSLFCLAATLRGNSPEKAKTFCSEGLQQDSLKGRQILYNGIVWSNKYHRIEGDQFLCSALFLPASVSMSGRTFNDVRIKYDIYSDEIITPVNNEDILQLNKEMVDSFSVTNEDKVYRFINVSRDSLKGLGGYCEALYKGRSSLYVKYRKAISPHSSPVSDGTFIENQSIYLVTPGRVLELSGTKSLYRDLISEKEEIRSFIKKNKLRISKKRPESFIPVIRFYDSLREPPVKK